MNLFSLSLRGLVPGLCRKVKTAILDLHGSRSAGSCTIVGTVGPMIRPRSSPGTDTGTVTILGTRTPQKTCANRGRPAIGGQKAVTDAHILAFLKLSVPQTRPAFRRRGFTGSAHGSGARAGALAQSCLILEPQACG